MHGTYDPVKATRVTRFFERVLRHPKDRYRAFKLIPWEREILCNIFGRMDVMGFRQVRRAYLEIAKKNGKSEVASGVALYMLAADDEPAAEVYGAATTREQAGIVFRTAAAMVRASPVLTKILRVVDSTKTIYKRSDPTSFYRAISADGGAQDGINPHCVIIDELHRWKTGRAFELYDVLTKGTVARKQPLVFEITTAGSTEDESPLCWLEHELTVNVNSGLFDDPHFYGRIFAAKPKDDWTLPDVWAKANPSLETNGGFLKLEVLESECLKAQNQPSRLPSFKRYHLGIWTSTEEAWMPVEQWDQCAGELRGIVERPCYLGLDLSSTIDLTSLVLLFPDSADDSFDVLPFFWMARERVRERELGDRVPYGTWAKDGLLDTPEGNVIDLRTVKEKIRWAQECFDIQEVAYDPAHANQLAIELNDELGLKCVPIPQVYGHMSEPTKKVMELTLNRKLRHGGNSLLRWNMSCVRVSEDGRDNVKPVKPKRFTSSKRIDGAVALIIATARAMYHRSSVYNTRGLITT